MPSANPAAFMNFYGHILEVSAPKGILMLDLRRVDTIAYAEQEGNIIVEYVTGGLKSSLWCNTVKEAIDILAVWRQSHS